MKPQKTLEMRAAKKKMLSDECIAWFKLQIEEYLRSQCLPNECYYRHKRCISISPHRHALAYVIYKEMGMTMRDTAKIVGYKEHGGLMKAVKYAQDKIDVNDAIIIKAIQSVRQFFLNK